MYIRNLSVVIKTYIDQYFYSAIAIMSRSFYWLYPMKCEVMTVSFAKILLLNNMIVFPPLWYSGILPPHYVILQNIDSLHTFPSTATSHPQSATNCAVWRLHYTVYKEALENLPELQTAQFRHCGRLEKVIFVYLPSSALFSTLAPNFRTF